ncbi:hypothetical protein V6Z11_D13G088700 [Gossypium hirsutum]
MTKTSKNQDKKFQVREYILFCLIVFMLIFV